MTSLTEALNISATCIDKDGNVCSSFIETPYNEAQIIGALRTLTDAYNGRLTRFAREKAREREIKKAVRQTLLNCANELLEEKGV